ncbi:pilus assembly protein TadG-related protein [Massilia sp. SYSU DXS3249]
MANVLLAPPPPRRLPARQQGGVAIIVALAIATLFAVGGVVLDLGHLFVNKTELQNAADACALAAAGQLTCDPAGAGCPASFLADAEAAGTFVAARNVSDFQDNPVAIAAGDVRFHTQIGPNEAYLARDAGADPNSKFVRCIARSAPIDTWLMQVREKVAPTTVEAAAVATLAPGQTACNASPIGVCAKPGAAAPSYGYAVGEWIVGKFNGANNDESNLEGNFRWVDFTPSAGGASEVRDQLLGNSSVCNIRVGDDVREEGVKQGAKSAWNTRFGIYPNGAGAPAPSQVAPDKTGHAYPSKAPAVINVGQSAYTDYRAQQAAHTPFDTKNYAPNGAAGNVNGNPLSQAEHLAYGADRRLVPVPLLECNKSPASVKILSMGCVLMLNPMSNGASGDLYLEWRGSASSAASPCRSAGVAGGTTGPLVPTLVQ